MEIGSKGYSDGLVWKSVLHGSCTYRNFAFGVIIIEDSIRPVELLQDSDSSENCIIESDPHLKIGPESHKDSLKGEVAHVVLCRLSRRTSLMLNSTPSELVCDFYGPRKKQDRSRP